MSRILAIIKIEVAPSKYFCLLLENPPTWITVKTKQQNFYLDLLELLNIFFSVTLIFALNNLILFLSFIIFFSLKGFFPEKKQKSFLLLWFVSKFLYVDILVIESNENVYVGGVPKYALGQSGMHGLIA